MKKARPAALAVLLALAAFAAMAMTAQAASTLVTLVSNEHTSICINPIEKGLEPTIVRGKKVVENTKPLTKTHKGGAFPDTGGACAPPEGAPMAFAIPMTGPGGPGQPAGPYTGTIAGASWVSYNIFGLDNSTFPTNPPPNYYIYDAEFQLTCRTKKPPTALSTVVHLYADNTGSAYINGRLIGGQPPGNSPSSHFDGPPAGGWEFVLGGAKGLVNGPNILQFLVLDETVPDTGVDFRAEVVNTEEKESNICSAEVIE